MKLGANCMLLMVLLANLKFLSGNQRNDGDDRGDMNEDVFAPNHKTEGLKIGQKLNETSLKPTRYLVYGVNPAEGFNLRRDVYIRVANLVKYLRQIGEDFILVLPPWRQLYHWRSNIKQSGVPWKQFFDIENLKKYIPVIEFDDYVRITGSSGIDLIAYLQRHPDGFKNGWEEKWEEAKCSSEPVYWKDGGKYVGNFWGLDHVYGKEFKCLSVQGSAKILTEFLQKEKAR